MPRRNRVTPWGDIVATPTRGTFMGNRGGRLHDAGGRLGGRRWATKAWLICLLSFRGRWSPVMPPNGYTRLFFLDEATALAAGHRPCAECRRAAFNAFMAAAAPDLPGPPRAPVLDAQLHGQRLDRRRCRATYEARLADLPDATFIAADDGAALVLGGRLYPWTFDGYARPRAADGAARVTVLTPRLTVAALSRGYRPALHATAGAGDRPPPS